MDRATWRAQLSETAIDPDLEIIDTHHHVYDLPAAEPWERYDLDALIRDAVDSGHKVVGTVCIGAVGHMRTSGPEHLRSVAQTEFVHAYTDYMRKAIPEAPAICAAIINGGIDMRFDRAAVGEALDAHVEASDRFRGIRHITAFDHELPPRYGAMGPHLMLEPGFRRGVAEIARRDLIFEAYLFQSQFDELLDMVAAIPDLRVVLDHTGGPLGVGSYAADPEATFERWANGMRELARYPQVRVKLGALNHDYTGMAATDVDMPFTSNQMAEGQRRHVLTAIDIFGPDRCMFESNFPVEMYWTGYIELWNSFKLMTADLTASERAALFSETARSTYRIG